MEAKEFVKDCGIEVAKRTLDNAIGFGCSGIELFGGKYVFRTDDLKTLVDAWELVEKFGGLESCYEKLYMLHELTEDPEPIREAIELVEQCQ